MNFQTATTVIAVQASVAVLLDSFNVSAAAAVLLTEGDDLMSSNSSTRNKPQGRFLRNGALLSPEDSFWASIDRQGDELEFLHFIGLTRSTFDTLADLCKIYISSNPLAPTTKTGNVTAKQLSRRAHDHREILAMAIKWLVSRGGAKDLAPHFGAVESNFCLCVGLGLRSIIANLIDHPQARVHWDRSAAALIAAAERTSAFLALPNTVGMLDGKRLRSLHPRTKRQQNRDYNGWTKDVNRNLVLLWCPFGKIIDCVVNPPGNFHDSKSSMYGNLYSHIKKLPDPYKIVCDSAFYTQGKMKGKLVKTKEYVEDEVPSDRDATLTHLRQCSEWGNNVLTGVFRRLKNELKTDNVRRGTTLWAAILLHNFRTENMDRNQIKTYFNDIVAKYNDNEE